MEWVQPRIAASYVWAFALLAGCSTGLPDEAASRPSAGSATGAAAIHRSDIVPLVDYHVHLLGPYALPLPDPLPPEIEVPAELRRLLSERAKLVGRVESTSDLEHVFTADARLLDAQIPPTDWMVDQHWFMRYINLGSPSWRLRYVPHAYRTGGATGYIAGIVVDDANSGYYFQNFLLAIEQKSDGRWRIAAESTTRRTPPRYTQPITAERLIVDLDEAGIHRAVVLSEAFWLGGPEGEGPRRMTPVSDPAAAVRAENDWTAAQVARYPDRLVMACGVNPLRDHAVAEVVRCAPLPGVIGMKLNFGDSGVDFHDAEHVEKVRNVFRAANQNRMAVIVHLEPGMWYGPAEVEIFLDRIASAAPGVTIHIAHLAGNGPGITSPEALEAFARLREAGDPRTANLWFDFAGLVHAELSATAAELMVTRMRQIGLDRILYASDSSPGTTANPSTHQHWTATRRNLPLTDEELSVVASNIAPYLR